MVKPPDVIQKDQLKEPPVASVYYLWLFPFPLPLSLPLPVPLPKPFADSFSEPFWDPLLEPLGVSFPLPLLLPVMWRWTVVLEPFVFFFGPGTLLGNSFYSQNHHKKSGQIH